MDVLEVRWAVLADVELTFTTRASTRYRVEKRNTLTPTDPWVEFPGEVTGSGAEMQWSDSGGAGESSRLYRVKVSQP